MRFAAAQARRSPLTRAALLLLAACSSPTGSDLSDFASGSVGTWNDGGKLGLAFMVAASSVTRGTVRAILTTPDPQVLQRSFEVNTLFGVRSRAYGWWVDSLSPRAGIYRLEAYFPGGASLNREMTVDPASRLTPPGSPSLSFTSSQAIIRWQQVAGAAVYYVELWRLGEQGEPVERRFDLLTDSLEVRVDLSALSLPAGTYRARVYASSADPRNFAELRDQLRNQFNVSSLWSAPQSR
ncbi:hypothetical protein HRbin33_00868 [bacterium HR33]|nr:hypothetical protein HRbin33_00868 [bacterium HR33]